MIKKILSIIIISLFFTGCDAGALIWYFFSNSEVEVNVEKIDHAEAVEKSDAGEETIEDGHFNGKIESEKYLEKEIRNLEYTPNRNYTPQSGRDLDYNPSKKE